MFPPLVLLLMLPLSSPNANIHLDIEQETGIETNYVNYFNDHDSGGDVI
jgi:hypothetical protein